MNMLVATKRSAAAAIFLLSGMTHALAQEDPDPESRMPGLTIDVPMALQNDWTAFAHPNGNQRTNLTAKIEPEINAQFTHEFSIRAGVTLEQVHLPPPGVDEAFEGEGLYLKTLTANWREDEWSAFAGKFIPDFGRAWNMAPGIYGQEFAKDYEFAEQMGFGGGGEIADWALGKLDIAASTFVRDRTFASRSLITSRGQTTEAMGGPSNTDRFGSYAAALNGHDIPGAGNLSYQLAYTYQARGEGDTADMTGVVGSLRNTFALTDDVTLTPLVEWAQFKNWNAVAGADRDFITLAGRFDRGPWNLALAYTNREIEGGTRGNDSSAQLSLGYTFDNDVMAEVGWWHLDNGGVKSEILGVKLSYEFESWMPF